MKLGNRKGAPPAPPLPLRPPNTSTPPGPHTHTPASPSRWDGTGTNSFLNINFAYRYLGACRGDFPRLPSTNSAQGVACGGEPGGEGRGAGIYL